MIREKGVLGEVLGNRCHGGGINIHQFSVVSEHRVDDVVHEIARQILIGEREIVETNGLIARQQRRIGARRNSVSISCGNVNRSLPISSDVGAIYLI